MEKTSPLQTAAEAKLNRLCGGLFECGGSALETLLLGLPRNCSREYFVTIRFYKNGSVKK